MRRGRFLGASSSRGVWGGEKTSVDEWERMAEWYDAKMGDEGDLWHRALIDPTLFRVLGDVRGQRVLDLACGNGYVARKLRRAGAEVVGVDASAPIIERARAREAAAPLGITYHLADAVRLDRLADGAFDSVVCNMALMDMEDAEGAIGEAARVLRPGGRFVASLCHPCFDTGPSSIWAVERTLRETTVFRKVSHYREPHEDRIPWRIAPDEIHETVSYHRPLSWYVRALRESGFALTALEEPAPTEEFVEEESPHGPWIVEIPMHVVFEATKGWSPSGEP